MANYAKQYANKDGIKTLLYILLGGFVIYAAVYGFKAFAGILELFGLKKSIEDDRTEALDKSEANAAVDKMRPEWGVLRYSDSHYQDIANKQFKAMNTVSYFINVPDLFEMLEGLNRNELLMVFKQFGVRIREVGVDSNPMNLASWYKEALSGTDLLLMKKVWALTTIVI